MAGIGCAAATGYAKGKLRAMAMGWDIYGCVEVMRDNGWSAVISIEPIITGRNYLAFATLFGIADAGYRGDPVAYLRGRPKDVSIDVAEELKHLRPRVGDDIDKAAFLTWIYWGEIERVSWNEVARNNTHQEKQESRSSLVGEEWELLFSLMKTLAQRFGNEHVRLVVWFDY